MPLRFVAWLYTFEVMKATQERVQSPQSRKDKNALF